MMLFLSVLLLWIWVAILNARVTHLAIRNAELEAKLKHLTEKPETQEQLY